MTVQFGLCQTWSETYIVDFLIGRLNYIKVKSPQTLMDNTQDITYSSSCVSYSINYSWFVIKRTAENLNPLAEHRKECTEL